MRILRSPPLQRNNVATYNGCTLWDTRDDHWRWDDQLNHSGAAVYDPQGRSVTFSATTENSCSAIRGDTLLTGGRFYWEVDLLRHLRGSVQTFGIGTPEAALSCENGYTLLGSDNYSYGLCTDGYIYHAGRAMPYTEPFVENEYSTVGILYDDLRGTLSFHRRGRCLGIAFKGLTESRSYFYPMVSSTPADVVMVLSIARCSLLSLRDRCLHMLTRAVKDYANVDALVIPVTLKNDLKLRITRRLL